MNFAIVYNTHTAFDQIKRMTQKSDEPVVSFGERIFTTAAASWSDIDFHNENECFVQTQLIHFFTHGLNNNKVKYKALFAQPPTLSQAIQVARDHIALLSQLMDMAQEEEPMDISQVL